MEMWWQGRYFRSDGKEVTKVYWNVAAVPYAMDGGNGCTWRQRV